MTVNRFGVDDKKLPALWISMIDKNAESMSHDNPENHWWIHQHMETLAEELWETVYSLERPEYVEDQEE
jgi:hypothetical protein